MSRKLIGETGKTQNIPDGYLLDFSSQHKPVLYLVEVELAKHDPLRHIAQQLLNFSLSFKSTPQKMKSILRDTLQKSPEALSTCEAYATKNSFSNIDYLLERMIYPENAFNALLIIDDLEEELESIVRSSLRFPRGDADLDEIPVSDWTMPSTSLTRSSMISASRAPRWAPKRATLQPSTQQRSTPLLCPHVRKAFKRRFFDRKYVEGGPHPFEHAAQAQIRGGVSGSSRIGDHVLR